LHDGTNAAPDSALRGWRLQSEGIAICEAEPGYG
jgi:hypothetical protein